MMPHSSHHPQSAWRSTSGQTASFPRLESDRSVEVAIIGGGFTGLATARELLAQNVECLIVEANDVGWGASGRTGGFAVPRYKKYFHALGRSHGDEAAMILHAQVLEAVDSVQETVECFDLACDFQRKGHMTPAHSPTALGRLSADAEWLGRVAGDRCPRILSREETSEALGTSVYHGAYLDPRGACMHPYDYVRGLACALARRGIPVFVGTKASRLRRDGTQWIIETRAARIRAKAVVLATNAYTEPLLPSDDLAQRIVPVASSIIATRPLNLNERKNTFPCELPVSDSKRVLSYFRLLPNGQLIFGGRGDITGRRDDPAVYRGIERQLAKVFPQIAGIEIQERWSGMVAVTLDDFPHLGRLDEGIFYALGYGGRGVALSSLMGRHLAKAVTGAPAAAGPMSEVGFERVPFHGWRRPAMRFMASYYRCRDKLER